MLAGLHRHAHAGHGADLARPHAAAVNGVFAGDIALGGRDAGDPALAGLDARDLDVLDDLGAVLACAFGQREGDIGRVALTVTGQEDTAGDTFQIEKRIVLLAFFR